MTPKIILLNGPPHCGKDTMALHLVNDHRFAQLRFAEILKNYCHKKYGLDVPFDYYENCKDEPHPDFGGKTPRQVYIDVSENEIKPKYGQQYYGQEVIKKVASLVSDPEYPQRFFVVSDLGFLDETLPVVEFFGKENVLIVHISRWGCSFAGDSRSYVTVDGVQLAEADNYHIVPYLGFADLLVNHWLLTGEVLEQTVEGYASREVIDALTST